MTAYAGQRNTIEKKLFVEETWGYSDGSFSLNETTAASTYTFMKMSHIDDLRIKISGIFKYHITYIRLREKIGSWDFKFVLRL